jgi:hypothetical protein
MSDDAWRADAARAHWQCLQEVDLPQFVIYKSPADYPGKFVVRMWRVGPKMGPTSRVLINPQMSGFGDKAEILCSF